MIFSERIVIIFFLFSILLTSCVQNGNSRINNKANESEFKNIIPDSVEVIQPPAINNTEKILVEMGLVNIQDSIPQIIVDLKYATTDNFLGFDFYGELKDAYVQPECVDKLRNAYNELQKEKQGYTFIIYDAVRSIESQQLMWDSLDVPLNKRHWYVANPEKGSIHNYGMALDLTLVDNNGYILDMGTDFDYFGELAFPNKTEYFHNKGDLTNEQFHNRNLLMSIMKKSGFYVSTTEWWHYNASTLMDAKKKYKLFSLNEI